MGSQEETLIRSEPPTPSKAASATAADPRSQTVQSLVRALHIMTILGEADGAPVGHAAESVYRTRTLAFGPGDMLLLYNNAVLAALPGDGGRAAERTLADLAVPALQAPGPDEACDRMVEALARAVGDRPGQDMTLVLLAKDACTFPWAER